MSEIVVAKKDDRLYLDTMIIIAYFHKGHRLHSKAEQIIVNIQKEKYEGIVSLLTLMEFVKVLREAFVKQNHMNIAENDKDINTKIGQLFRINNLCFVEGRAPEFKDSLSEADNVYFNSVSQKAFEIMSKYIGKIAKDENDEMEHKGIHAMDAFHIALAKAIACDKIVTDDYAFWDTKDEIIPLVITDVNAYF